MLDPKLLRSDLDGVAKALARRGFELDTGHLAEWEARRKVLFENAAKLYKIDAPDVPPPVPVG